MEFSLNLDSWMSITQSEKSDGTKNRTIGDIRKAIDNEFDKIVKIFITNKY